ncbi:MAG: hypothetical protein ACYC54_11405 [Sedimentisphaerales bacterium]
MENTQTTVSNNFKRRLQKRYPASLKATLSNHIYYFKEHTQKHPENRVILYVRDSTCSQRYKGNLNTQDKFLRHELKMLNISIPDCFCEIGSGCIRDNSERAILAQAVKKAVELKLPILALSANRFLRSIDFNPKTNPSVLPTENELARLKAITQNVMLLTWLHPDLPDKDVRGFFSKIGQIAKGNKGGRPRQQIPGYKKRERLEKLPIVLELHNRKVKRCDIARMTGLKWDRVDSLIKNHAKTSFGRKDR